MDNLKYLKIKKMSPQLLVVTLRFQLNFTQNKSTLNWISVTKIFTQALAKTGILFI